MYIFGHSISTKTDSPCPLTHYLPNLHYSPTSAHLTSLANYWIVGMSHWLPLAEFASSISATTRDQVWALATLSLPLINRFLLRCLLVLNHWPNWSLTWLINHVLLPPLITLDLAYLHLDTKTHSPRDNQNHLSLMYIVHTKTSSHLSAIPYFLTPIQAQTQILPCAPTHSILHDSGLWESSFMR